MSIADLRREYTTRGLREEDLDPSPVIQFRKWFQEALSAELTDPNAMTLATASRKGKPSARVVLLKDFDHRGFVFYSNYESKKGREIHENPYAAIVFFWAEVERQVIMNGKVSRLPRKESEEYFLSRPVGSQIGAWASRQSRVISGPEILESRVKELEHKYEGKKIPMPSYWGGFLLSPNSFEFWQGRPNRLHDRLRYTLQSEGHWRIERLSP